MLQDYPKDVQARVPPKTSAEQRETRWWGILFLALLFGAPLAAAIVAKLQQPDLSFAGGFFIALVVLLVFIGGQGGLIPLLADPLGRGWHLLPNQGYQVSFAGSWR